MKNAYFVFDVESVGLHGEGFAVGYVLIDADGRVIFEGYDACDPDRAQGDHEGRGWIAEHVVPFSPEPTCDTPETVRCLFRVSWVSASHWAQEEGRTLYMGADVAWPVEARFLLDAFGVKGPRLTHSGKNAPAPYPLIDIASVRLAKGLDPLETCERLENEGPAHNALNDARQSARLLLEALRR